MYKGFDLNQILKNPHIRINEKHAAGSGVLSQPKSVQKPKQKLPEVQQYTRTEGRPGVVMLTLPYLLPMLSERQRCVNWQRYARRQWINRLQKDVSALIVEQHGNWIYAPFGNALIVVERVSAANWEPDGDNMAASVKELVDVLQPLHPTIRTYGLGIIAGDHPEVLRRSIQWRRPVAGEEQGTVVRVELRPDKYYENIPF